MPSEVKGLSLDACILSDWPAEACRLGCSAQEGRSRRREDYVKPVEGAGEGPQLGPRLCFNRKLGHQPLCDQSGLCYGVRERSHGFSGLQRPLSKAASLLDRIVALWLWLRRVHGLTWKEPCRRAFELNFEHFPRGSGDRRLPGAKTAGLGVGNGSGCAEVASKSSRLGRHTY